MDEIEQLLQNLEKLRLNLESVMVKKGFDLQDPEVLAASRLLDAVIVKYIEMIDKKL